MRVVICHPGLSGYFAACWRALSREPGFELFILAQQAKGTDTPFDEALMAGLPHRLLSPSERESFAIVKSIVIEQRPDVLVIPGWYFDAYTRLAFDSSMTNCPVVVTADTSLSRSWRQHLARYRLRPLIRRASAFVTPGERGFQFWRFIGAPERKIHRALLGVDYESLAGLLPTRMSVPAGWPRRFLFLGRYVPVKAIDVLVEAYGQYRTAVSEPWPLTTCGSGPQALLLKDQPGIDDRGFIQPQCIGSVMADSGVFVLPSRFEPWGQVIPEACAAGLPVIASSVCGSGVELIRPYYSGLFVPSDDPEALAEAMRWFHEHHADLPTMGRHAQALAEPFSAAAWARRWAEMLRSL